MKQIIINLILLAWLIIPIAPVIAANNVPITTPAPAQQDCSGASGLCLNVPIGSVKVVSGFEEYLQLWYSFVVGVVGILATVIMMWGGFKWLTSRGNAAAIGDAKDRIWSAVIGLVLVFLSYNLLWIINPKLVEINLPTLLGSGNKTNISNTTNLPADFVIDSNSGITYGTHPVFGTQTMFVEPNASPAQLAKAQTECHSMCVGQGYGTGKIGGNSNQGFTCQCDITSGLTVNLPSSDPLYIFASNPEQLGLIFTRNDQGQIAISWNKPLNNEGINTMIQIFQQDGYQVTDNRTSPIPHIAVLRIGGSIINP